MNPVTLMLIVLWGLELFGGGLGYYRGYYRCHAVLDPGVARAVCGGDLHRGCHCDDPGQAAHGL